MGELGSKILVYFSEDCAVPEMVQGNGGKGTYLCLYPGNLPPFTVWSMAFKINSLIEMVQKGHSGG